MCYCPDDIVDEVFPEGIEKLTPKSTKEELRAILKRVVPKKKRDQAKGKAKMSSM